MRILFYTSANIETKDNDKYLTIMVKRVSEEGIVISKKEAKRKIHNTELLMEAKYLTSYYLADISRGIYGDDPDLEKLIDDIITSARKNV